MNYETIKGQVGGIEYEAILYPPSHPEGKFEVRFCQRNVWSDPARRYGYGFRVFDTLDKARAFVQAYIAGDDNPASWENFTSWSALGETWAGKGTGGES